MLDGSCASRCRPRPPRGRLVSPAPPSRLAIAGRGAAPRFQPAGHAAPRSPAPLPEPCASRRAGPAASPAPRIHRTFFLTFTSFIFAIERRYFDPIRHLQPHFFPNTPFSASFRSPSIEPFPAHAAQVPDPRPLRPDRRSGTRETPFRPCYGPRLTSPFREGTLRLLQRHGRSRPPCGPTPAGSSRQDFPPPRARCLSISLMFCQLSYHIIFIYNLP
jgi:hypothetical protein